MKWFVIREQVELSKAQIEAFRAILWKNSRPVQLLDWRKVFVDTEGGK